MDKKLLQILVDEGLKQGADFSETFYEDTETKNYIYTDNKLDKIVCDRKKGVGIRLALLENIYYSFTNNLEVEHLKALIRNLGINIPKNNLLSSKKLQEEIIDQKEYTIISDKKKKEYLSYINIYARKYSEKVIQVFTNFYERNQVVTIANNYGKLVTEKRNLTRLVISIISSDSSKTAQAIKFFGGNNGYDFINNLDIDKEIEQIVNISIKKLNASSCQGGEMPVIIGPAFGAVIFHEACGHAMEATSVAKGTSVLNGKLNQKIGSNKVTIIDDGTIKNCWGTTLIDDEGNRTKKNLLIENGILRNYLIDDLNGRKLKMPSNGCSRRENYMNAPTSRMNNTYLLKGNDKIEDMIKSIKNGLYAKTMSGGSVNTITGDFNFAVDEGYIIKDGEIGEIVKDASLIGNTLDILNQIEMVSDDFELGTGWCGSDSGSVPVCIGQPTIKVSNILVGGEKND